MCWALSLSMSDRIHDLFLRQMNHTFDLEVMKWLSRDNLPFTAATSNALKRFYDIMCAKGKVFEKNFYIFLILSLKTIQAIVNYT